MACNQRYPVNIENSSTQNTKLIIYFIKVSVNLFRNLLQTSVRCFTAHQRYVCYILYGIADNDFIDCM